MPGSTCWEDKEGAGSTRALNIGPGGWKRSLNLFPSSSVIVKKCLRIFPTSSPIVNFPFSGHVNIVLEWLRVNNPQKRGQLQLGRIIRRWAILCLLKVLISLLEVFQDGGLRMLILDGHSWFQTLDMEDRVR